MRLFHRHFGKGDPVVILHGLFGLSDNWVSFGRDLADRFSVFIPDLRNHGQSPHSDVFDFPAMESDLSEFLEDHDLRKIRLVGHSLGGKVAMFFALHNPDVVERLVVVDISLRKSPPNRQHQQLLNAMTGVDFSGAATRSDVDRQLEKVISDPVLRQFLLKSVYWRDRTTLDWRLNLRAINNNLLSVFEGVDVPGSVYPGPALFVRGGRSDYILDDDIPEIQSKFPGSEVITLAKASHWVHADAPGEFLESVTAFLGKG